MYNQLTPEIIDQIKSVSSNVFLGEDINPDYARDEMPIYGTHMPDMAVQPRFWRFRLSPALREHVCIFVLTWHYEDGKEQRFR